LSKKSSDGVTSDDENRQSKKKKPGRVKGPHKSRENLGRPTILDTDLTQQQEDQQQTEESKDESEPEIQQLDANDGRKLHTQLNLNFKLCSSRQTGHSRFYCSSW